ncbi:MAG: YraN family protein [Vampirovibrionales bacterium]
MPSTSFNTTRRVGNQGEALAWAHLNALGYGHVAYNWHAGRLGELDGIFTHPQEKRLVFVEVKSRRGYSATEALLAITPAKQKQLVALVQAFLAQHPQWQDWDMGIDVVGVSWPNRHQPPTIIHVENAVVGD